MPGNGAYAFTEPGDYEANVEEAKIELLVTGGGPFKASLTRAGLGELHLLRSHENLASVAFATLRADWAFVAFPTRFDPPPVWDGEALRPGEIVLHGLGERVHWRAAGPSGKGFIALAPKRLAFWSHALTETEIAPPTIARIVRPSGSAAKCLLHLYAAACRLVEDSPQTIAHPEVARALEQELIDALIACLAPDSRPQSRPIRARRAAVMNRLEETLAAHPDRPLHMPELCAAVGASERTLRLCCAEFLGTSPARYLRLRQLRLVRAALRRPDSSTATVAAVARRYGFGELGRFASLYCDVYGEAPSATLRLRRH